MKTISNPDWDTVENLTNIGVAIGEQYEAWERERVRAEKSERLLKDLPNSPDRLHVLIVQDEMMSYLVIKEYFEAQEYDDMTVTIVRNFNDAYDAVTQTDYDVVIFDVIAPGTDEKRAGFYVSLEHVRWKILWSGATAEDLRMAGVPEKIEADLVKRLDVVGRDVIEETILDLREIWQHEHARAASMPSKDTAFRLLVMDMKEYEGNGVKSTFASSFGDEVVVTVVTTLDDAMHALQTTLYDMFAFDLVTLIDGCSGRDDLREREASFYDAVRMVPHPVVFSRMTNENVRENVPEDILVRAIKTKSVALLTQEVAYILNEQAEEAEIVMRKKKALGYEPFRVLAMDRKVEELQQLKDSLESTYGDAVIVTTVVALPDAMRAFQRDTYDMVAFDMGTLIDGCTSGAGSSTEKEAAFYDHVREVPYPVVYSEMPNDMVDGDVPADIMARAFKTKTPMRLRYIIQPVLDTRKAAMRAAEPYAVLIVQDEPTLHSLFVAGIMFGPVELRDISVDVVSSFDEAIDKMHSRLYAHVVYDIVAPGDQEAFLKQLEVVSHCTGYSAIANPRSELSPELIDRLDSGQDNLVRSASKTPDDMLDYIVERYQNTRSKRDSVLNNTSIARSDMLVYSRAGRIGEQLVKRIGVLDDKAQVVTTVAALETQMQQAGVGCVVVDIDAKSDFDDVKRCAAVLLEEKAACRIIFVTHSSAAITNVVAQFEMGTVMVVEKPLHIPTLRRLFENKENVFDVRHALRSA